METEEEHNSPFDMIMNVMDHFNLNMIIGHVKEDTVEDMITEDEMVREVTRVSRLGLEGEPANSTSASATSSSSSSSSSSNRNQAAPPTRGQPNPAQGQAQTLHREG